MKTFSESRLVAKMLLEINAINFNVENPFSLSSGFLSPSYIDCRKIIIYPKMILLKNYQNSLSKKGIILYTKDGRYDPLNPTD